MITASVVVAAELILLISVAKEIRNLYCLVCSCFAKWADTTRNV